MGIDEKRYPVLLWSIVIVVLMWEAHFFSIFNVVNGFTYDVLTRLNLRSNASEQVIVIDGDKHFATLGDDAWLPILKSLLASPIKQVVFNFLPEQVSSAFYQMAADSGKVVFGQDLQKSDPYSELKLTPLPLAAQGKNLNIATISVPPHQNGVYRAQQLFTMVDDLRLPTIEQAATKLPVAQSADIKESEYMVNFIGGTSRIPKVKLEQLVSGSLVADILNGRTVLIGLYGVDPVGGYYTPICNDDELTPDVLFHAFALDTLLANRTIREIKEWEMLVVISIISATALLLCQYMLFQRVFFVALFLSVLFVFLSWVGLQVFFYWIAPVELILALWLSIILAWRHRVLEEHQILNNSLEVLSSHLLEKSFRSQHEKYDEEWLEIIDMVNQSLNLNRMLFLERIPKENRVIETGSFKCSIDDLVEQRRDYKRTPYSNAIQENKPVLLDRPFLTPAADNDKQYLVPLLFADDILGFWAFSVNSNTIESTDRFHSLIKAYMVQISEFLYEKKEWEMKKALENNRLLSFLNFQALPNPYHTLRHSVALLDGRVSQLQQVFNNLNTGGVLYDLFGKVILLNKHMEEMAQSFDLKIYSMTALDFVMAVTGFDSDEAQKLLRRTIFDFETAAIPVARLNSDSDYLFHIQPIRIKGDSKESSETGAAFPVLGVLCELEDVTDVRVVYRIKEDLFDRLNRQLQQHFKFIEKKMAKIHSDSQNETLQLESFTDMQNSIEKNHTILDAVAKQMKRHIGHLVSTVGSYPIDSQKIVEKVIAGLTKYAEGRFIDIHLEAPETVGLVFASPKEFYHLIKTVILGMIDDTLDGTDVFIVVIETSDNIQYHFSNRGIGLISNHIEYQGKGSLSDLTTQMHFRKFKEYVEHWQGNLELSSLVGEGSKVILTLKRFF